MDIKLDNYANIKWDDKSLGTFDGSSELAEKIDSDQDGTITNAELEKYKEQKAEEDKQNQPSSYTVAENASGSAAGEVDDLLKGKT